MDDLAGQIVEHFPTEDKVFSKSNEILKGRKFFKAFFYNLHRKLGVIATVPEHAVAFWSVLTTYVETQTIKPAIQSRKHRSLTLL